jgi:hypothetical protein
VNSKVELSYGSFGSVWWGLRSEACGLLYFLVFFSYSSKKIPQKLFATFKKKY